VPVRSRSDGNVQLSKYSLRECARHRADPAPSDQIGSAEVSVQNRWFKQKYTVFTSPKDDLCLEVCQLGVGTAAVGTLSQCYGTLSVYAGGSSQTLVTVTSASQAGKRGIYSRDKVFRGSYSALLDPIRPRKPTLHNRGLTLPSDPA
jgi:hypothetical protein